MKLVLKVALTVILPFLLVTVVKAQKKVELFCQVAYSSYSFKYKVEINYGSRNNFDGIKDSLELLTKLDSVNKFKNGIDAIDYLKGEGWEVVSIAATNNSTLAYFKKEFEK